MTPGCASATTLLGAALALTGCTGRWVVWPTGADLCTHQEDAGSPESREGAVIDGERFVDGERVPGTGCVVGLEALPGEGRPSGGTYAERG